MEGNRRGEKCKKKKKRGKGKIEVEISSNWTFQDPVNERFRLHESPGYNDRLQFSAFVCDKASAPGGLNKFHNTLHFDPR